MLHSVYACVHYCVGKPLGSSLDALGGRDGVHVQAW